MRILDIYNFLDEVSPFETQESWDNSGLLVGEFDTKVERVYCSLDLDSDMLKTIEDNSLVITHHPLIFKALKRINFSDYSSKLLRELIKRDISLISMHTNFDKSHLNRYTVENFLGFEVLNQAEYLTTFRVDMSFEKFYNFICEKFKLKSPNIVKTREYIQSASIVTGSGSSFLKFASDTLLTGDIKYHEAMEAKELGINLIDIGHFESEIIFSEILAKEFEKFKSLKKSQLKVIISNSNNPFSRGI